MFSRGQHQKIRKRICTPQNITNKKKRREYNITFFKTCNITALGEVSYMNQASFKTGCDCTKRIMFPTSQNNNFL